MGYSFRTSIDNLLNGISQQPPQRRLTSQADEQINAFSSPLHGLSKRTPLKRGVQLTVGGVPVSIPADAQSEWLDVDDQSYLVTLHQGTLMVFNAETGEGVPVSTSGYARAYLNTNLTGHNDYQLMVAGERLMILNRGASPKMALDTVVPNAPEAIVWVKVGRTETTYTITVAGVTVTYTTDANTSSTTTITTALATAINNNATLQGKKIGALARGSLIRLYTYFTGDTYNVSCACTGEYFEGGAAGAIKRTTIDTSLPRKTVVTITHGLSNSIPEGSVHKYTLTLEGITWELSISSQKSSRYSDTYEGRAEVVRGLFKAMNMPGDSYRKTINGKVFQFVDNLDGSFNIELVLPVAEDWPLIASDTHGDSCISVIKGAVQKIEDLPPRGWEGFKVKVVNRSVTDLDDYWLVYRGDSWSETTAPGVPFRFDPTTLPVLLSVSGTNAYLEACPWLPRKIGDDVTIKPPSFIDQRISSMVLYKDRLGFTTESENIIFTRSSDYFNLWPASSAQVVDSDPIDVCVGELRKVRLRHMVPFAGNLMLLGTEGQFLLTSNQVFSPKDVAAEHLTSYCLPSDSLCQPVGLGSSLFVVREGGPLHSRILEYKPNREGNITDPEDITDNVPQYVPKDIRVMVPVDPMGTLLCLAPSAPSKIFVYTFLSTSEDNYISSWSHLEMGEGINILGMCWNKDRVSVLYTQDGCGCLGSFEPWPRAGADEIYMDSMFQATGVYDPVARYTTIQKPYRGSVRAAYQGVEQLIAAQTPTEVCVYGKYDVDPLILGLPYTMRYTLSQMFIRPEGDSVTPPIEGGRLQLLRAAIKYDARMTKHLSVDVYRRNFKGCTKLTGVSTVRQIDNRVTPVLYTANDAQAVRDCYLETPVRCASTEAVITITNDTMYPSVILGVDYLATYNDRVKRR